jgi:hypothetical protein
MIGAVIGGLALLSFKDPLEKENLLQIEKEDPLQKSISEATGKIMARELVAIIASYALPHPMEKIRSWIQKRMKEDPWKVLCQPHCIFSLRMNISSELKNIQERWDALSLPKDLIKELHSNSPTHLDLRGLLLNERMLQQLAAAVPNVRSVDMSDWDSNGRNNGVHLPDGNYALLFPRVEIIWLSRRGPCYGDTFQLFQLFANGHAHLQNIYIRGFEGRYKEDVEPFLKKFPKLVHVYMNLTSVARKNQARVCAEAS